MDFLPAELVENFHFLRPLFLWGLLPALILVCLILFIQSNRSTWTRAIDPSLLPFLLADFGEDRQYFLADGLHPNVSAQGLIMKHVFSALNPILTNCLPD